MYYTKSQLAKECNMPDSTLHDRLEDFCEFFFPLNENNQSYYTNRDCYKLRIIQGMRKSKPAHSTNEIRKVLKEITEDFRKLDELDRFLNKLK
ncbi:MerR family transcriptional regulator [Priestia megaterium]|uniref:MerR family transcriptional regulator n=1 Tax=Priestia megaterium TaxID=1404 RepID=UPI003D95FD6A